MAATTKKGKEETTDTNLAVTADTLSDIASKAPLGGINERETFLINLCESRKNIECLEKTTSLNEKIIKLEERYIGLLREIRDKLQSVNFDDFLKIIVGILSGIVARAFTKDGSNAVGEPVVKWSIFFLIFFSIFLIIRLFGPSKRKNEIIKELDSIKGEKEK